MSTHKIDACGCRPDRGHSHARVFTKPLRELTPDTTEGFRAIRLATLLGLSLMPWQRWLLLHALELLPDGKLRFGTVVVIVSRQNGKSTLSCVWFLWQLFVMKTKFCAGIAQNLDTAKEIWESVCEMVLSRGALRKQMKGDVVRTNGQLALRLTGGRRYRPFSVERGVARGLSFGAVLIDEIQYHRNFDMWSSVSKTVLAVPNSQVMALGTAGDDRSVVLAQLRGSAMAALDEGRTDTTLGLFEFSAEPGREIGDFEGWREANPAGGYTIPWSGIMGAMEKDPPAVFRTECLGHWVPSLDSPVDLIAWSASADRVGDLTKDAKSRSLHLAIDMAPDMQHATLLAGGVSGGDAGVGRVRIQPVKSWSGDSVLNQVSADLPELVRKIQPRSLSWFNVGGGAVLAPLVKELPISSSRVIEVSPQETLRICMRFAERVASRAVLHPDDPLINAQMSATATQGGPDGWKFRRSTKDSAHVDAVYAAAAVVNAALFDAATPKTLELITSEGTT